MARIGEDEVLLGKTGGYQTCTSISSSPLDRISTCASENEEEVNSIISGAMEWSRWGLVVAYMSILLMSFATSLEGQVTYALSAFAVSSFRNHSMLSTVYVVQGVVNAVIKPPMAKLAEVFGRGRAFAFSVCLCVVGYILMASSQNVEMYASAQIFYAAGGTGLQILQQIFIADTSNLLNRALLAGLPNVPFLVTVWIGPIIASAILATTTWRWGYGMWAVILPAAYLPLALSLLVNKRKTRGHGRQPKSSRDMSMVSSALELLLDLDAVGIVLLSTGFSLILLPLTLASGMDGGWCNPAIAGYLVTGVVCLLVFLLWEAQSSWAPQPLVPLALLKSRTFCAGCGLGFFFFMVFYLSVQPYFYSYLLVVQNQSVTAAGRITQTFSFAATISTLITSLGIKHVRRYKPFVVAGSLVYTVGIGLMLRYRQQNASIAVLIVIQTVLGIGAGMLHGPAQLGVQAAAGARYSVGAATAVFMTMVEMGGAVGAAVSGALWGTLIPSRLEHYLPDSEKQFARQIYSSVVEASTRYPWGSVAREAVNRSYQEAMTWLLVVALAMCLPVVGLGLLMKDYRLDKMGTDESLGSAGGEGQVKVVPNMTDISTISPSVSEADTWRHARCGQGSTT